MRHLNRKLQFLTFTLLLFISCQKDDVTELKSRILFSVDLDIAKFDPDTEQVYIAAYASDGSLLNYGSLSDSAKWDLKAEYKDDKIDILLIGINQGSVDIKHIINVNIGETFTDPNSSKSNRVSIDPIYCTLKVEDFGNHKENNTATNAISSWPYKHKRGHSYPFGEFFWDKIEDGYTYVKTLIELEPKYQGLELSMFERGSNKPYVSYVNIPVDNINEGDTIILRKTDFTLGELHTIHVNSSYNEYDNMFLYTYNSVTDRKDLITSFEHVPNSSRKDIRYISSEILPISHWDFRYFAYWAKTTSYSIRSNKMMPSSIEVKELKGQSIAKAEDHFNFTHSHIFAEKNLSRSYVKFYKDIRSSSMQYTLFFEGNESLGEVKIKPFIIPKEILDKSIDFTHMNSLEWGKCEYFQIYTDILGNSPLDYLKSSLLNWSDNDSSINDYTYEAYSIRL